MSARLKMGGAASFMMPRLWTLWERIRGSLWAMPLAMMLAGALLAMLALRLRLEGSGDVWWLYSGNARDAPEFMASLLGSMITMGTLAISITMVVLTLAAQQLGPRLIRNFMDDWRTQAALGLFLGTIVYLLLVLRALHGQLGQEGLPNLAVTVGTGFVLSSTITLLLFVHHLAHSIVADHVIERVGAALDKAAAALLPSTGGRRAGGTPPPLPPDAAPLRHPRGGYVQAIDYDELVSHAEKHDALISLEVRPGHHVLPGGTLGWIAPPSARTEALAQTFAAAVLIGSERTAVQDLEFAVRQLVEVALRALSPGVNDPFTALAAIDRLSLSLARIMRRAPAEAVRRDKQGTVRLVVPTSTFEGLVETAFNQIRQIGEPHPAVLIHLMEKIVQLAGDADAMQRPVLQHHMAMVLAAGRRSIKEPADLAALEGRATPGSLHPPPVPASS